LVSLVLLLGALTSFAFVLHNAERVRLTHIAVLGATLLSIAVVLAPRDSRDVYMYAMFGSILGNHEESPYLHSPEEFPSDPFLNETTPGWRHVRSPYGPGFALASGGVVVVSQGSATLARVIFQAMGALALATSAFAIHRRGRDRRSVVVLLLNPATIAMVNGGHNDLLVAALLVFALLATRSARPVVVGLLLASAVSIKITAGLPVAALLGWLWFQNRKKAVRVTVVCASLTAVLYIVAGPTHVAGSIRDSAMVTSRASLWSLPSHFLSDTVLLALAGACVPAVAYVVWRHFRRGSAATAVAVMALVPSILSPYVLPWYGAPALFLAALSGPERLRWAACAPAAALLLAYVNPPGASNEGLFAVVSAFALPSAALLVVVVLRRATAVRPVAPSPKAI